MGKVDLKLDWCSYEAAKYACEHWHYSQCMPAGKTVKVGAWERGIFKGVIIFSRGTCGHLAVSYGCDQQTACELTRIALTDHAFLVSRAIKIALKMLRSLFPTMRLVISFASKTEGHHGGIYQATNWIYSGETSPKVEFEYKGKRVPDRVISEIVRKTGIKRRELERRGIVKELPTENKHRYLMPLDDEMRQRIEPLRKPYPKRPKQAMASDQEEQRRGSADPDAPFSEVNHAE